MIAIPTIETERLRLESISLSHSEGMFRLWSHKDVCRHSGVVSDTSGDTIETPVQDSSYSDLIIDFWLHAMQEGWGFRWAVILKENNTFLGTIGFNSLVEYYEIAFHLHPDYWGQGIMTEASCAAIDWAQEQGAIGIAAYVEPENIASISLSKKLGMIPTGEFSEGAEQYVLTFVPTSGIQAEPVTV